MPSLSEDMRYQCQKQLSEQVWQEEVVSRLPAETEAQARTLRAFLYTRAFACACDLLRGLLCYVVFTCSLRELGCFGVLSGIADISDRAWSKRMSQAGVWLWWLVRTLLQLPAPIAGACCRILPSACSSWMARRLEKKEVQEINGVCTSRTTSRRDNCITSP